MDKTTLDLLKAIKGVADDYPRKRVLGEYFHLWREAGYPNLPKPTAPAQGTCWTCAHNSAIRDCAAVDWRHGSQREIIEWIDADDDWPGGEDEGMPPRDYSGSPCPGWKAKEQS